MQSNQSKNQRWQKTKRQIVGRLSIHIYDKNLFTLCLLIKNIRLLAHEFFVFQKFTLSTIHSIITNIFLNSPTLTVQKRLPLQYLLHY